MNFFYYLYINFTFVFQSCKCVRLHIEIIPRQVSNKLFVEISLYENEFTNLTGAFLLRNCHILSVFQSSFTSNLLRIWS
jgi:hypothetical protein